MALPGRKPGAARRLPRPGRLGYRLRCRQPGRPQCTQDAVAGSARTRRRGRPHRIGRVPRTGPGGGRHRLLPATTTRVKMRTPNKRLKAFIPNGPACLRPRINFRCRQTRPGGTPGARAAPDRNSGPELGVSARTARRSHSGALTAASAATAVAAESGGSCRLRRCCAVGSRAISLAKRKLVHRFRSGRSGAFQAAFSHRQASRSAITAPHGRTR